MPRLSLISIAFQNLPELQLTCASVDAQTLPPHQHLIIDGSKDAAIKTWLETTPQPHFRQWICEPDHGISDAFNKGIRNATGSIILLLNSGDALYGSTVLQQVFAAFAAQPALQWLHGKVKLHRGGKDVIVGKPFEPAKLYRGMRSVLHQTMYVRTDLYRRHGLYSTTLRYSMDFDFLCRIAREPFAFLDAPLAIYDTTGVSSTQYLPAMAEARAVYRKYYGHSLASQLWGLRLAGLYHLLRSPLGKLLYRVKTALKLENS